MNELERLLTDDVDRLIDRIATSVPPNTIARLLVSEDACGAVTTALRLRDAVGRAVSRFRAHYRGPRCSPRTRGADLLRRACRVCRSRSTRGAARIPRSAAIQERSASSRGV